MSDIVVSPLVLGPYHFEAAELKSCRLKLDAVISPVVERKSLRLGLDFWFENGKKDRQVQRGHDGPVPTQFSTYPLEIDKLLSGKAYDLESFWRNVPFKVGEPRSEAFFFHILESTLAREGEIKEGVRDSGVLNLWVLFGGTQCLVRVPLRIANHFFDFKP